MAVHFLAFVSFREFPLNVSQVLLSPSLIARNRPAYYLLRYIPFLFPAACPPSSLVVRFLFRVAQFSPYTPSTYRSRLRGLPLWLAPFRAWILRTGAPLLLLMMSAILLLTFVCAHCAQSTRIGELIHMLLKLRTPHIP